MKAAEVLRRLRALIALAPGERPISIDRLEQVADVGENEVYKLARGVAKMSERTRIKLARALTLVENDQLVVRPGNRKSIEPEERRDRILTRPARPPMQTHARLAFTPGGPKVVFEAVNPRAFPKLDPIVK